MLYNSGTLYCIAGTDEAKIALSDKGRSPRLLFLGGYMSEEFECKSCFTMHYCDLIKMGNINECPCMTCILKSICYETCEKFSDKYESIIGFKPTSAKGW